MMHTEHLQFSSGKGHEILRDISLDAQQGHFLALLGNNGAGKSTLLKCLNGIFHGKGVVAVNGQEILTMKRKAIAQTMAYVEQANEAEQLTVYDVVLMGRKPFIKVNPTKKDIAIVEQAMERMELTDFAMRYVDEISGGELQKVIIARALAQQPKVLLLDEPTSSLDPHNQHEVMSIMEEIVREDQITVIVVIHDLNLALRYCNRFLFLQDGLVYDYGDASIITEQAISEIYHVSSHVLELEGRRFVVVG